MERTTQSTVSDIAVRIALLPFSVPIEPFYLTDVSDAFPEMIRINGINVQKIHEWNLKRAHNYSLRIDFKVHFAATKVFLQLMLQIGGNSVRLPFFRKDLCQTNSGLQCPLFQNERYHFKLKVGIPEQTPKVDGRLRMRLINEHGQILLCSIFPLTVVD